MLPPGQYVKINRSALARTDLLTRYRAHAIALRNQFMVPNEARDIEDKAPLPGGDKPLPLATAKPEETGQ